LANFWEFYFFKVAYNSFIWLFWSWSK